MEKMFNKLVRDNIPNIIENNGESAITRKLSDQEYKLELLKKLKEECDEVINSKNNDELMEEFADLLEVIDSIIEIEGLSKNKIESIQKKKRLSRGGFKKKIFLVKTVEKK